MRRRDIRSCSCMASRARARSSSRRSCASRATATRRRGSTKSTTTQREGAADRSAVNAQIDRRIAALKERTGSSKVDVVAHSLGTFVMHDYLTDPVQGAKRRANVAHYINVDGQSANPGVPTLAIWAGIPLSGAARLGSRHMDGAQNVTVPNQTHVQTCTSRESFVQYFRFLSGKRPAHDIVRRRGAIKVAGRALTFPQNQGLAGATIQVWPLTADGHRATSAPAASVAVTDGAEGGGGS